MKTVKAVNLHELKKINKNSIREGYNRNIYFTRFKMDLMSEMKNLRDKSIIMEATIKK